MSEADDVRNGRAVIAMALSKVMEDCTYVQKTKTNKFHNYTYAGEGDLLAVLRPAMVKHGLLLLPSVESISGIDEFGNTTVIVEYTLAHRDGHIWPFKLRAVGTGNDKNSKGGIGDKGTYKALTGANKYLLFKLFQIETGDDPEQDDPPLERPAKQVVIDPPDESVVQMLLDKIGEYASNEALKKWWEEQKKNLIAYGIVNEVGHPGADAYKRLVSAMINKAADNKAAEPPPKGGENPMKGRNMADDVPFMYEWR